MGSASSLLEMFTPLFISHCVMNSSNFVQSPVKIRGGLLTSLLVPCIGMGAGARGGGPPLGGPPLGGPILEILLPGVLLWEILQLGVLLQVCLVGVVLLQKGYFGLTGISEPVGLCLVDLVDLGV
jgi:hypothetical protein